MAVYKYKIRDKTGKLFSGIMEAKNTEALALHFQNMGYTPIAISEKKSKGINELLSKFKRIKLKDINLLTRQLATFESAGMPLLSSLKALEDQTENSYLKRIVSEIREDVEAGFELSDALEKHPKVFSPLYINMVRTGEASGRLKEILFRLAELGEKEEIIRSEIKSATRYPIIVICAIVLVALGISTFVLPKFAALFMRFGTELPLPTRVLISVSHIIKNYWFLIFLGFGVFLFLFFKFINTKKGRYLWDNYKLHMPLFGKIFVGITMARFSRILGILLQSGLPLLKSLDLVAKIVGNTIIAEAIVKVKDHVREGGDMSAPMRSQKVFPAMVVHLVATGEESGVLDSLLLKAAEHFDREVSTSIKNLTTLIEPILVLILGGVVLSLALAVFLPMWNMIQLFRQ